MKIALAIILICLFALGCLTLPAPRTHVKAEEMPDAYQSTPLDNMVDFAKAMFRYWTEDDFAASFRRMLTLEQFRSEEMARLYQQYLAGGPMDYMADLFAGAGLARPREEAAAFYAPMFLLYSVYDAAEDKAAVLSLLDGVMENARGHLKGIEGSK